MWERKNNEKNMWPNESKWRVRIRTNRELMDLYREADIISEIRKERVRWLERVERMLEERTVKKVFKNIPGGKHSVGKPRSK
jgi:hypothetical protein